MHRMRMPFFNADDGSGGGGGAGISDMAGLNGLLDQLGGNPAAGDAGAGDQDPPPGDGAGAGAGDQDPPPEGEGNQDPPPDDDKQAQAHRAFAQLRAENNAIKKALTTFAQANDIQFNDLGELVSKIQEIDLKKRAAAQNIPEDVLRRIEMLEQQNMQYTAAELRTQTLVGMQKLQDDFGADKKEIQAFTAQLLEEGINPLEQYVDLRKEYIARNFDTIAQRKIDLAVQEALKRAGAAGSNPPGKQGGESGGKDISTMADLNGLLDQLK